ncbi:MAG TPA: M48 family metalloprotease [Actinomycetota bacterium]|nr:M48 family metalloprotease [Actinomycetota bacterium]
MSAAPDAPARPQLPDWDYVSPRPGAGAPARDLTRSRLAIVLAVALAGAALAWLLLGLLGVAAFAASFSGALVWTVSNSGRGMLRRVRAAPLQRGASPRLANVVGGLAPKAGVPAPELWLIEDDAPNALVCFTRRPAIGVTTGLVESFTRTELEAVIAHCLVRLATTSTPLARTMLALSTVSPLFGVPVGDVDDVRTAALTRYPPALASAVTKATPRRGRGAAFWFVADDAMHVPPAQRAAALLDL